MPDNPQIIEIKRALDKAEKGDTSLIMEFVKKFMDTGGGIIKAIAVSPFLAYIATWFVIDFMEKQSYIDWKAAYQVVEFQPITHLILKAPPPDKWPFLDIMTSGNLKSTITGFFAASAAAGLLNVANVAGIISALKGPVE